MRVTKSLFYLLLLFAFVFQSCSIEKRHYTNGYSLQWKKNKPTVKTDNSEEAVAQTKKQVETESVVDEPTLSVKNVNALTASVETKKDIFLVAPDSIGCDTIIMRNETEIKVKVIEITPTEVKYKYCDNLTGPLYVSYRYEVSYIKYANGKLDSFKDEFAPVKTASNKQVGSPSYSGSSNYTASDYINNRNSEKAKKTSLVALIFSCISLVPIFGFPAIFIGMSMGFRALKLIKRNPRELEMYRPRALAAVAIAAAVLLLYIVLLGYLIMQTGGLLQFLI
jgi:hypothetical protein